MRYALILCALLFMVAPEPGLAQSGEGEIYTPADQPPVVCWVDGLSCCDCLCGGACVEALACDDQQLQSFDAYLDGDPIAMGDADGWLSFYVDTDSLPAGTYSLCLVAVDSSGHETKLCYVLEKEDEDSCTLVKCSAVEPPGGEGNLKVIVWEDKDGSGDESMGDARLPYARISLYNSTDGTSAVVASDSNGEYLFSGLSSTDVITVRVIGPNPPGSWSANSPAEITLSVAPESLSVAEFFVMR